MPKRWKHTPQTVRPRSAQKTPALLCLLVFGLTAIFVYRAGSASWIPASLKPTHSAAAYVVQRVEKTSAGDVRVPLAYADADARRAEDAANALAERYVAERREEWKRSAEEKCLAARKAAGTAYRDLTQSEARLEMFQRETGKHVAKPQAAAPAMIDNPEWLDLSRRLTGLQQYRDKLLVDRTPLHPAVQEVAIKIDELQRQMANTQRQIGSPPAKEAEAEQGNDDLAAQDREKLDALTAAVDASRWACQQAETAEKLALERQQAGPQYSVVYAQAVEVPPPPDYGWWRSVWTALAAATFMALGVGAAAIGAGIEPPVASVLEVQAEAQTPIIGTVPAKDSVPDLLALNRRQARTRRTLVAVGAILIAASPLVAACGIFRM